MLFSVNLFLSMDNVNLMVQLLAMCDSDIGYNIKYL